MIIVMHRFHLDKFLEYVPVDIPANEKALIHMSLPKK